MCCIVTRYSQMLRIMVTWWSEPIGDSKGRPSRPLTHKYEPGLLTNVKRRENQSARERQRERECARKGECAKEGNLNSMKHLVPLPITILSTNISLILNSLSPYQLN